MAPFPRYVPLDVLKGIQKLKPTVFPGAPSLYISLLQQKNVDKFDLKSINCCVSGSAPMPVEHMKQFAKRTGSEISEGYGLTEASPVTHFNPLEGVRKPGSIGLPFPDTDAKIVDNGRGRRAAAPGQAGRAGHPGSPGDEGVLQTARTPRPTCSATAGSTPAT